MGAEERDEGRSRNIWILVAAFLLLVAAGLGYLGYRILDRLETMDARVAEMSEQARVATEKSDRALDEASRAENAARLAAEGRSLAEADALRAREETASAQLDAASAREAAGEARVEADAARAEAERIRKEAEAEMARLEEALGKIAETRRTALGLVMNLGEDTLKFDFDKADLKPENRELLSRIAGILLTSSDYTLSVNGHTDDVGTDEYNQKLSERRARAVYDYMLEAGVPPEIITMQGWGKTKPLVEGKTNEARARNRRVELGIVNARVNFRGAAKN
jgi:outer membrane protein OmpA-like peptidoglycan-associated protein